MAIGIYLIENHLLLQRTTSDYINKLCSLSIRGASDSGREALAQIPLVRPSLVIVDTNIKDMNGIDVVKKLQQSSPEILTMMLSSYQESYFVKRALEAGVKGYVVKGYPEQIEICIRHMLSGEIYLCPRSKKALFSSF